MNKTEFGSKFEIVEIVSIQFISGTGNCEDIDECKTKGHDCHSDAYCENTIGSWNCECQNGYKGDGTECRDLNECDLG